MSAHDQEIEDLKEGVSCATVLERKAWKLDKMESTRHCWKYRRGAGELLIVNHSGRGWWDPRSQAKGDVFALAQFLEPGLNFGQVRHLLRALSGVAPAFPAALVAYKQKRPELSPAARWTARRRLTRGSPTWCYLARTRALEGPVLVAAARADALREGPCASAWFAHRDAAATIVGIEMRGPEYRGFSADGDKTLFQLAGRLPTSSAAVTRLVVCEAPIDAMSLAGIERLRTDTLYVSTAGAMGPHTIAALQVSLRDLATRPGSILVAATDADAAGEHYATQLVELATAAGVRSGRILPFGGHKDWNQVVVARRQALGALPAHARSGRATGMSGQQAEPVRAGQPGTRLIVMDGYGMSSIEGIIVGGTKDEDGTWDLDGRFVLLTDDGERLTVNGWCCLIEVEEAGGEGRED